MATYKFDRDRKRLYKHFGQQGLSMCRIMNRLEWVVLGLTPAPILSYRDGEWQAESEELQQMIRQALNRR